MVPGFLDFKMSKKMFIDIITYIRSVVSSELKVSPVETIDCGMSDLVDPSL